MAPASELAPRPVASAALREPEGRSNAGSGPPDANLTEKMAVTLRSHQAAGSRTGPRMRVKLMEKFVIEGGVPLSGTMIPAGNKNGALPILASSVLTEDEVIVRNVPRIRDG